MDGRGFMFPVDTAIGKDGRMHTVSRAYVPATAQLRITMYDIDSQYFGVYGAYGEALGEFKWPTGMASDSDGNIYVSDEQNNRINIFSHDGEPMRHWGEVGIKEGQLNGPSGIAFDKEQNLFVADHLNNRIQKFTKDGGFIMSFGNQGGEALRMPWGLCVGEDDSVYVADWGNERVQILDPDGDFCQLLKGEATLSKWAEEWLEVNPDEYDLRKDSDLDIKQLPDHLKTPYHIASQTEPIFWGPVSVMIDDKDQLFVTEHSRHRIQVYSPGKTQTTAAI